jgi:flavodoxin
MNTAIIYYSLTGHSDFFVKKLSKNIEADVFRLKSTKYIPKTNLLKHLYCSFVAGIERKHSIEAIAFNSEKYDLVILVTPIWFGKLPPAFNTFFKENVLNCEIVMVYSCFVAFSYLTDLINKKYIKGSGEITQSYVIYDQKPSSYSKVSELIKIDVKEKKYTVDSDEIHYNLLYD